MGEGRHYWRYRVHVDYWDGYVNIFFDSLEDAKRYQESVLKKEYVTSATVSEEPKPPGSSQSSERFKDEIV
jgi:hypothetical protein